MSTKLQKKATKKILVPELTNVLEESPNEASDLHLLTFSDEDLLASIDPVIVLSPGTSSISDIASPSSTATVTSEKNVTPDDSSEVNSYKIESIEVEMVMKHLKEARIEVLKSEDLGISRKLLDALIGVLLEEYAGGVCDENKLLETLGKSNLVLLALMLVMLVVFVVWSFTLGAGGIATPFPT